MRVTRLWMTGGDRDVATVTREGRAHELAVAAATCTTAHLAGAGSSADNGDPTELALLRLTAALGVPVSTAERDAARTALYAFDPRSKRMSTVAGGVDSRRTRSRTGRRGRPAPRAGSTRRHRPR
jgi:magnesium-transporting ATPase (P-type)